MAVAPARNLPFVDEIRERFPSLASGFAYLENAGGSQLPKEVPDAVRDYMLSSYVQLGAGYEASRIATDTVTRAHAFSNRLMGGEGIGQTILGASTTALLAMLGRCYGEVLPKGSRIIAAEIGHESSIGPWDKLGKQGYDFRLWRIEPDTFESPLDHLKDLLEQGDTRLVSLTHVSNLLGEIVDLAPIVNLCRRFGARVVVDGVAFTPHRPVDVAAFGADWYVFSCYKVYGPHMAALFGRQSALEELNAPNHFFLDSMPYKFEPGGITHEGCAGWLATGEYLKWVAGETGELSRAGVVRAFTHFGMMEMPLQRRFIDFLLSRPDIRIIGPAHADANRVTTISFVHERFKPSQIVAEVHRHAVGIRYGNAYAYRLCQALGFDATEGVVRASFVHYNTLEEVDRLCSAIDDALQSLDA